MSNVSLPPGQPGPNMPPPGGPPIPGLKDIKLNFFTLTPAAIKAGESVEVQWSTTVPRGLGGVRFFLQGLSVGSSGKHSFRPVVNTAYGLTAERYGAYRPLASQSLVVDTSVCTLTGISKAVADLEFFAQTGVYDLFALHDFKREVLTGVTVHVREENFADSTLQFDAATGQLKLNLQTTITLDAIAGDGQLNANVWFQLAAHDGMVVALATNVETNLNLPWGVWLVGLGAIAGPAAFFAMSAIIGLLNSLAPDLASGAIQSELGPLAAAIGQPFGDRVSSVTIGMGTRNPGDDPEPFVFTTACP